ncbi:MAG TPA: HupE/UreJ family protein [Fibrobacteria bacterium]|nr:HupE/UreJ family protein [Fibrobacteria bacterium]
MTSFTLRAAAIAIRFLLISLFVSLASAHPTGVSKIDLHIKRDSVAVTVDVNRNDLFYALGVTSQETMTKAEYGLLSDRIALYFQSRVPITFDKPAPGGMKVLHWNKLSSDPSVKMDSLAFADTTIVMRFGCPLPPGATRMDIQAKLFAELPVQPLAHVRVLWGDPGKETVINRRFLGLDGRMVMPILSDSLVAMAARLEADSARPTDAGGDENVFVRFLRLGFLHILPHGQDHILFVLGLFFFSTALRPLLIQVTAFTIAHSITLGLALVGVVSLPAKIVEPLIALSIAVVALENIFFRRLKPSRWIVVFGFGLIHGMGFAGVLQGLGLPEGQFLSTLVGFNLGVEAGQIAVISLAFAATFWARHRPWYFRFVVVPVSAAIALVGLYWTVQRVTGG